MPQVTQAGAINTTALIVPDLYVNIVSPQNLIPNGIPSNILGYVGTAIWGPVNRSTIVGGNAQYVANFGQIQNRKYDMGTGVYIASLQGASNFRCVRVTDGTDTAASTTVLTNCLTLTALYTGSLGNSITVKVVAGQAANTYAVQVAVPGYPAEQFGNIGGTGNALWANIAAAITSGVGTTRGASAWVVGTAGGGTTAPVLNTVYTLSGGTDGATTITAATLVGADTLPRSGIYALRNQGCGVVVLADADDSTQWVVQGAFGLSESCYVIMTAAAGTAIQNGSNGVVDLKQQAGLDNYDAKLMHGDWLYWYDQVNKVTRLTSPQHFEAGKLANLAPQNSPLNKPIYGIVASQKSGLVNTGQLAVYAEAELQVLFQNGVDVICNPAPGGSFWATRRGCNTSSNPAVNGDNYTRLTNYIATSLAAVFGIFIGEIITLDLMRRVRSALMAFLGNMADQRQISAPDGSTPYSVICDLTNNPQTRTALGYLQSDVQVIYGPILLFLNINLEGGQTVTIAKSITANGQQVVTN